jgi:UDP-glucose 4-epimerase
MKSSKILVTGSHGFIGTHLCKRLLKAENCLVGKRNNFDITEKRFVDSFPTDEIDIIVHLAAKTSISAAMNSPYETYFTNILGTLNVLEFARRKNIQKLIYLSTFVYGQPKYLPIDENHPVNPHSSYSKSKLTSEELCRDYSRDFGIDIVTLRPFNVYGPGSKPYTLISSLILQIVKKNKVSLAAKQIKRDFIFIEDLINLMMVILREFPHGYNFYNVGYGKGHTLERATETIASLLKQKANITYESKSSAGNIGSIIADITKVSNTFNWRPIVGLEEGLKLTLGTYR